MCIDSKTSEIVCINPVRSQPDEIIMDTYDSDPLKLHQISGGSVVVHAPIFSSNEENLFVIWNNKIRCFNVTTGELLRDFDGLADGNVLLGMKIHGDCLVACTDDGNVVTWKQKSGIIVSNVSLYDVPTKVLAFDIMTINKETMILLHFKQNVRRGLELRRLHSGKMYQPLDEPVSVRSSSIKISVGSAEQQYFCFIQDYQLKMVQFNEQGRYRFNKIGNEFLTDFTVVACHPTEELVATGDRTGKILVIRNMFSNSRIVKQIYHWHASQVNALCWSTLGRNFYSGGDQCVLVKWTLDAPLDKDFYPRMPGALLHIATTAHSDNFAVSTSDNGIYMFKSNRLIGQIQNFTWISEDGTGLSKFPAGMRVNPRNTSLVLNGRAGHLQFYSPHTRSLLFNIDTTLQNHLSKESDKIIYNTRITNVALTLNWMATGEVWDDKEHMTELRLKFWAFDEQNQRYTLNTNVEFPHEGLITALEFSNLYDTGDLLCASAGKDNIIKIWSLDDSESIYRKGKVWTCIKKLAYKLHPVSTVSFSQDGSLLAAGVGNSLCIWTMDDKFQMKCALTAPSALDGSASKVLSVVGNGKVENLTTAKVQQEKQKKVLEQMRALLDKSDTFTIKPAPDKCRMVPKKTKNERILPRDLSGKEKEFVCRRIFGLNELNVSQKVDLCARLGVSCKLGSQLTHELLARHNRGDIKKSLARLAIDKKYEYKRRFANITRRRSKLNTISLRKLLNFSGDFSNVAKKVKLSNGTAGKNSFLHMNGHATSNGVEKTENGEIGETPKKEASEEVTPVKNLAQIKHLLFGHSDYCHLVIVCTENRMLFWNLLTLRLQTAVRLSVQHIAIDSFTNVMAAFTKHNELYIFLPGTPIPLYHRKNMPNVEGVAWIPRRQPRSQSINVDWQATSQLYFITDKQELMCLTDKNDLETVAPSKFFGDTAQPLPKTPFAAMMAKQISNDRVKSKSLLWSKVGTKEKDAVKEVMNLSNHAMPAVNRLCKDFLKTLLVVDRNDPVTSTNDKDLDLQKLDNDPSKHESTSAVDESDDEKTDSSMVKRMLKTKQVDIALKATTGAETIEADYFKQEKTLKKIATKDIKFNF